jgi:nucleotide-binding universal stress UspA family protein
MDGLSEQRSRFRRPWVTSVLAGVDESDDGRLALAWAARVAEAFAARLIVVDVWENPAQFSGPIPHHSKEQERRFQRILALLEVADLDIELVPAVGNPAEALLKTADEYNADLIVIGNHHRGRLHQLLHRGTRSRLLRRSSCAVLIAGVDDHHHAPRLRRNRLV